MWLAQNQDRFYKQWPWNIEIKWKRNEIRDSSKSYKNH